MCLLQLESSFQPFSWLLGVGVGALQYFNVPCVNAFLKILFSTLGQYRSLPSVVPDAPQYTDSLAFSLQVLSQVQGCVMWPSSMEQGIWGASFFLSRLSSNPLVLLFLTHLHPHLWRYLVAPVLDMLGWLLQGKSW